MSGVLITGTDTGVGKTLVCRHLAAYLRGLGVKVITQKWVQTGGGDDIAEHGPPDGAGLSLAALRVPYRLAHPSSPHLAARRQGAAIDIARIRSAYAGLARRCDLVLVEGTGGLLVPLTERVLLADVAAQLALPVVIVAANKLGCINHALLSLEAARSRGLRVLGLIFNRAAGGGEEAVLRDNPRIVAALGRAPVLGEMSGPDADAAAFRPIGEAILRRWKKLAHE